MMRCKRLACRFRSRNVRFVFTLLKRNIKDPELRCRNLPVAAFEAASVNRHLKTGRFICHTGAKEQGRAIVLKFIHRIFFLSVLTVFTAQAGGQDLMIYPAKGQSQQQMEKDKFTCHSFAKQQSGFDPTQTPPLTSAAAYPPPPGSAAGGVVRGGAGGAALGAAIGGIAGGWSGAGKGAAIGALTGGVFGGLRSQARNAQVAQAQQQVAAQQAAQYQQKRNDYNRATSVCLEAKGYAVK